MWEYLQVNIALFCLVSALLYVLRDVPARVRFYLRIFALLAWLVPWPLLHIPLPDAFIEPIKVFKTYELKDITHLFAEDLQLSFEEGLETTKLDKPQLVQVSDNHRDNIGSQFRYSISSLFAFGLLVAFLAGVIRLVCEFVRYRRMMANLYDLSIPADHLKEQYQVGLNRVHIRLAKHIGPGMTTGLFRPVIWVSDQQCDPAIIKSILMHELTHVQNHDVFWVWLVTSLENLFWWNPLFISVAKRARDDIELSCDEACQRKLEKNTYLSALAKVILQNNSAPNESDQILTIKSRYKFNLQRLRSLKVEKHFNSLHVCSIVVFFLLAAWMCIAFTYELRFRDFYQSVDDNFRIKTASNIAVEYDIRDKAFLQFMQYLYENDLPSASAEYPYLLEKTINSTTNKEVGFAVLSAYLGDMGEYQNIPKIFYQIFSDEEKYNFNAIRILSIAYLKLEEYDEAISALSRITRVRSKDFISKLLLAQAYHLRQDYHDSVRVIEQALNENISSFHRSKKDSFISLLGKNGLAIGDTDLMAQARSMLGVDAGYDFSDVKADQQRIPYTYFLYRGIEGKKISGFDLDGFSLRQEIPELQSPAHQRLFRKAERLASKGEFFKAKSSLNKILNGPRKNDLSSADLVRITEYLFVINMRLEDRLSLVALSEKLVAYPGVSADIKARAHWVLASGRDRHTSKKLSHFEQYKRLLPAHTLASDHETIERYYFFGDVKKAGAALARVCGFYERTGVIPDYRILNRIIGLYERLEDRDNETKYRKMYARYYSRTWNFALDTSVSYDAKASIAVR